MASPAPIRPSIALAAFAEKFIEGRRVLVFGNALSPFWEQLIERGARLVHVCDADASRVAEAAARNTSQHVSFAPLSGMGLAVRDGAFDVGFIDNLTEFSDPAQTIHKLKRALSSRGIALVCAPNAEVEQPLVGASLEAERPVDYYTLYDLVHREFPVVRMAGQMPFVGYSVAELAPAEEPQPCFDAGFVPGGTEEPEWFIAIASHSECEFESFVVVQLPHEHLLKNGSERLLREQLRTARAAERGAVERLARLEAEQRKFTEAAGRQQKDVDLARQVRLLQEELERKESWILQLEARAATADARADHVEQELFGLYDKIGLEQDNNTILTPVVVPNVTALQTECQDLRKQLEAATQDAQAQKKLALEAEQREQKTAQQLTETQSQKLALETANGELRTTLTANDVARQQTLETVTAEFRAKLDAAEAASREIRGELEALKSKNGELVAKLEAADPELEQELGRLEAQLVERGKLVQELEVKLAKTERVGTQLLRELERARQLANREPSVAASVNETTNPAEPTNTKEATTVVTVSTEAWTQSPTVAASASTEQSGEQVSAWTESSTTSTAELEELHNKLDHLAALAARQQADLGASHWRLEQMKAENQELLGRVTEHEQLANELSTVRQRLQETEVLLAQIRWREATSSDEGPLR